MPPLICLKVSTRQLNQKRVDVGDDLQSLDALKEELYLANKEFRETRQKMLEALENSTASEALVDDLENKLEGFPSLSEKLGEDQELQDANKAKRLAAEREKQAMEDARDRSKRNISDNLEEKKRLEEEAKKKLEEAIYVRDSVNNELRQFLLDEFNNVKLMPTHFILLPRMM
jgi:hypothetical protein